MTNKHDNKDGQTASEKGSSVITLPLDQGEYFPILTEANASTMRSGLVTLKPGAEVGWHSTEDYEELILVLEGQGELLSQGGTARAIALGQVAYNPPDSRHNVRNSGTSPLRYIYVVSRA